MLTLADLLISLKNRLRTAMAEHNKEMIRDLRITFGEMADASYGDGNEKFCALLEDLEYATNHIGLADWKAEAAIPSDEQIYAAFISSDKKPEQE
jgi:hypothetical protein